MADSEGRLPDLTEREADLLNAFLSGALWERWQISLNPIAYWNSTTLRRDRKAAAEAMYYHRPKAADASR